MRKNGYPELHGGERFGRLTIIEEFSEVVKYKKIRRVRCVCDCGNIIVTNKKCIMSGNTKSCGCLRKEIAVKAFKYRRLQTYTYKGETHTMMEWSKILGINEDTLRSRKIKYGDNVDMIFGKKTRTYN